MLAAVIVVIGKSYKSNLSSSTISPINFGTKKKTKKQPKREALVINTFRLL